MTSFGHCTTPSRPTAVPYHFSTTDEDVDGRWKRVTFDTSLQSLSPENRDSIYEDYVRRGHSSALHGTIMGTPYHYRSSTPSSAVASTKVDEDEEEVLLHVEETKPRRLIESGAVRVHIAKYTNPRRGERENHRSPSSADVAGEEEENTLQETKRLRLIESGAVRVHVAQYTNPRRGRNQHGSPSPSSPEVAVEEEENHLYEEETKPLRLIESGAVRVRIAQYTNTRRGLDKHGSHRLIDQGAVRLQITRHTTPRRKPVYATRHGRMLLSATPLPPSTSSTNPIRVPQTEIRPRHGMLSSSMANTTTVYYGVTPSKQRSNAYFGGGEHKFRAILSPNITTPVVTAEIDSMENEENGCIRDLPRTLFE